MIKYPELEERECHSTPSLPAQTARDEEKDKATARSGGGQGLMGGGLDVNGGIKVRREAMEGKIYRLMKVKRNGRIQRAAWREERAGGRRGGEVGLVKVKRDFVRPLFYILP